jgi:hypothetical protein
MANRFDFTIGGSDAGGSDSVARVRRELGTLDQQLDSTGKMFAGIEEKIKAGFENPMGLAMQTVHQLGEKWGLMGAALTAGIGIFTTAGAAGFEAAKGLGEYSTQLGRTAARLGDTIEATFNLDFAMKRSGGSLESVEGVLRKLSQALTDTSEEGKKGRDQLAALGVTAYDAATGKLRPMTDVVIQLAEKLGEIPEAARRNDAAIRVLGRGALAIVPDLLQMGEGLRRAKELGIAPNESEMARWEGYHKQIADLAARWDSLARKVKEPLAATFSLTMKGFAGDTADIGAAAGAALRGQVGKTPPAELQARLEALRASGFGDQLEIGGIQDAIDRYLDRDLFGGARMKVDKSRIGRALLGVDDAAGELGLAKKSLTELQDQLRSMQQLGGPFGKQEELAGKIEAQKAVVAGIEAQTKATIDLLAAGRSVAAFERRMGLVEMGPATKILTEGEQLIGEHSLKGDMPERVRSAARIGATAALVKEEDEVFAHGSKNILKYLDDSDKAMQEVYKGAGAAAQRAVDIWIHTGEEVRQISVQGQISRAGMDSRQRIGFLGQAAGPGQEVALANAEMVERLALAQRIYGLQVAEADTLHDSQARRLAYARSYAELLDSQHATELDHELRIGQLQRARLDERRAMGAGLFDALVGGPGGLRQFGMNFLQGQGRMLAGNAFAELTSEFSGHVGLAGKIFQGTVLGKDPLKDAMGLNTLATAENTAALRSLALSSSGGGGRFSSAASTFARLMEGGSEVPGWDAAHPDQITPEGAAWGEEFWGGGGGGLSGWGRAAGIGGAAAGGAMGIYSGVRSGGARGVLTAAGSGMAAAGAVLALASKAMAWAGPVGMIAGMSLGVLTGMLPDPRHTRDQEMVDRLTAARYSAPAASSYARDRYGRTFDTDVSGGLRITVNIPVQAIDSRDFMDRAPEIVRMVTGALEDRVSPRLMTAVRNTVRVG